MRKAHSFRKSENYANLYEFCKNCDYFYASSPQKKIFAAMFKNFSSRSQSLESPFSKINLNVLIFEFKRKNFLLLVKKYLSE